MLKVIVNGEGRDVAAGTTIAALVDSLGRGTKGIAVAVNADVVPRSRWEATAVNTGDRIEVLTAKQGG